MKIFLILLPTILMMMSKLEGHTALSLLERTSAGKYHIFLLVNVFFGSIITGAAFEQLQKFLNQSPAEIPKTVGVAIPMKATFFITYIMVDGWAGVAAEVLRLVPLIIFHIKNTFLVKTVGENRKRQGTGNGTWFYKYCHIRTSYTAIFLVGTRILGHHTFYFTFHHHILCLLVIFRHQIINVYDQKYEWRCVLARCAPSCDYRINNITTFANGTFEYK